MRELKLRPFKGMFSTKRLPMRVLTDASDVLSSGALPCTVMLSDLLPMVSAKSRRACWSASMIRPFWWTVLNPSASTVRARHERRHAIHALLVGGCPAGGAGRRALDHHQGAGHGETAGIGDVTGDRAGRSALRGSWACGPPKEMKIGAEPDV